MSSERKDLVEYLRKNFPIKPCVGVVVDYDEIAKHLIDVLNCDIDWTITPNNDEYYDEIVIELYSLAYTTYDPNEEGEKQESYILERFVTEVIPLVMKRVNLKAQNGLKIFKKYRSTHRL